METIEQLDYRRKIECDDLQGYLFSRPTGAQDPFQKWRDQPASLAGGETA